MPLKKTGRDLQQYAAAVPNRSEFSECSHCPEDPGKNNQAEYAEDPLLKILLELYTSFQVLKEQERGEIFVTFHISKNFPPVLL